MTAISKPLILTLLLANAPCFALQTYPLHDHQSTTITISENEHNRIAILGDRIHQIFGAEGAFDVQSDEEGGQVFLRTLTTSHSKPIPITMITESGLTQDLKLIPKAIESQSILFNPSKLSRENQLIREEKKESLSGLINLIKAMVADKDLPNTIKMSLVQNDRKVKTQELRTSKTSGAYPLGSAFVASSLYSSAQDIKIDPLFLYKREDFEGKVYILTNQGKETISLKESDFAIAGDLAIAFEKILLPPGEQSKLYVITRPLSMKPILKGIISGRQS